jgi:hypothetical protein
MVSLGGNVDMNMVTNTLWGWVRAPITWVIFFIVLAVVFIAALYIRKKRRLTVPTVEVVNYGTSKAGFNHLKSGWFGKQLMFKGLWWKGPEVLRASTGEEIRDFSTEDYQTVDGKRGVVCFRSPTNQDILVPISKVRIDGQHMVMDIAPAEYIDAAKEIYSDTKKETTDSREKLMQLASWALVVIVSLLCIIFIIQGWTHTMTESKDLLLQAGQTGLANCKAMCVDVMQAVKGLPV